MKWFVAFVVAPIILGVAGLTLLLAAWSGDRSLPVDVKRVWVAPGVVKACQDVELWVDRFAMRRTGLRIEIFLTNSFKQSHVPLTTSTWDLRGPVGEYSYSVGLNVPCLFKPGWVDVERRVYYYRNPLQEFIWPIPGPTARARFCVTEDGKRPEEVCKPE